MQRQREYHEWLDSRPAPARDDMEADDSYETFMRDRRSREERERAEQRRCKRWADRGLPAPEVVPHTSPEQLQREYELYCTQVGVLQNVDTWRRFLSYRTNERRRSLYAARRAEQCGPQKKRGRPPDPETAQRREQRRKVESEMADQHAERRQARRDAAYAKAGA